MTGIIVLFVLRWRINILALNENEAASLGMNVRRMRLIIIVMATLITAGCVSMCGIIGWVGMLVPHVCRMIFGSNYRYVLPAGISLGAAFMLVIDTLARSATAGEIPVSILTAIIGAPVFILLLRKTGGKSL
jgi:iron complex transport system permease protein